MKNLLSFVLLLLVVVSYAQFQTGSPWPTWSGSQNRTGNSPLILDVTNYTPKKAWERSLGSGAGQWTLYLAVNATGDFFVGGTGVHPRTYQLTSFNPSGEENWSYEYKTEFYNPGQASNIVLGESLIYWGVPPEMIMGLDYNGTQVWQQVSNTGIMSVDPLVYQSDIYGYNYYFEDIPKQKLRGFNLQTGALDFNGTTTSGDDERLSMSSDGTIYTSDCDFIQSYSLTGELYFRAVVKFACFSHVSINETSGNVYSVADFVRSDFGRRVFGFSSGGEQMWNFTLAPRAINYYVGDRVAIYNGRVFATTDNVLVCLDQITGEEIWLLEIPDRSSTVYAISPPVVDASGQIFVLVSNTLTQATSVYGYDQSGTNIYVSESFACSIQGIGSDFAISTSSTFIVLCRNAVAYFK